VSRVARFPIVAVVILANLLLIGACGGRSSLDEALVADGGAADATARSSCNGSTCSSGCCDSNGVCQPGAVTNACGTSGHACRDCAATSFQSCDAATHACTTSVIQCNAATCSGCCTGGVCFNGNDPNVCGSGGHACIQCSSPDQTCTGQQCVSVAPPPPCGSSNCKGCCAGQVCMPGTDQAACGARGIACAPCATMCAPTGTGGSACTPTPPPPPCSRATCPAGCCDGLGNCQPGVGNAMCGSLGVSCQSCSQRGEQCTSQQCVAVRDAGPCNAQTCPAGCCDSTGTCRGGDLRTQCGTAGSACQNCQTSCFGGQCAFPPEAGRCDGLTCSGCCDAAGACQMGLADTQCGLFGGLCQNCSQSGQQCSAQRCVSAPDAAVCNEQTCPFGCCDALGKCQPGSSNSTCGAFGDLCQNCAQQPGTQCFGQQCQSGIDAGACSAITCPTGCCDSFGYCQQGLTGLACGGLGTNCQNCLDLGGGCSALQQCVVLSSDGGSGCNQQTCLFGCCDGSGLCQPGFMSDQCGGGGQLCLNCTALGGQCLGRACTAPDGGTPCAQSCSGCCDTGGRCQGGFVGQQCGENGAMCQDCTMLKPASTCDVNVSPRVCASQQTECPAPYPSCPTPLQEPAPARQMVCSTGDLQNAAAACSGGAEAAACNSFFGSVNPACAACLQPFDVDFGSQSGIRTCVAPFLDATCNHNSACIVDCTAETCFACADSASTSQCQTQAQSTTCSMYTQADQCVTQALAGAGAVCNPTTYQGNFGGWVQGVGAKYCGP
jgi:hypothetical protein